MFRKYANQCILTLLFFNYATAIVLFDDGSDNEVLSTDEKFLDLEDNILQRLETLDRLEDFINKANQDSAENKNKLANVERKLPEIEEKIEKTLDFIEKIPEYFEKINQRLDALEIVPKLEEQDKKIKDVGDKLESLAPKLDSLAKWSFETKSHTEQTLKAIRRINNRLDVLENSPKPDTSRDRVIRASSPKTDRDLKELEDRVENLEKDYIANNKLYNENLFKTEIVEVDDSDKSLIERSGCKYLSLKDQDLQAFQTDNDTMSLVTVAYNQLGTYRHVNRVDFESHIAIRATGDVYILLWEVDVPELSGTLDPDYEIGLGAKGGFVTLKLRNGDYWRAATPTILAPDQYKKFYIKAYDGALEFGSRCDEPPLHVHKVQRSGNIVAIGFLSKALNGAKILLDCPATSCAEL